MKLMTETELTAYVQAKLDQQKIEHDWEIRRFTAKVEDLTEERDRFRGAYKRGLNKLEKYRLKLADAQRELLAAGVDPAGEAAKDGAPRRPTVQTIMDDLMSEIPGMDDSSQQVTKLYVERELRKRGTGEADEILAEVLAGDGN